jgi:hypothetical protein
MSQPVIGRLPGIRLCSRKCLPKTQNRHRSNLRRFRMFRSLPPLRIFYMREANAGRRFNRPGTLTSSTLISTAERSALRWADRRKRPDGVRSSRTVGMRVLLSSRLGPVLEVLSGRALVFCTTDTVPGGRSRRGRLFACRDWGGMRRFGRAADSRDRKRTSGDDAVVDRRAGRVRGFLPPYP